MFVPATLSDLMFYKVPANSKNTTAYIYKPIALKSSVTPCYVLLELGTSLLFSFEPLAMKKDDRTMLNDITDRTDRWTILVRVFRRWNMYHKDKPKDLAAICFVLVDEDVSIDWFCCCMV